MSLRSSASNSRMASAWALFGRYRRSAAERLQLDVLAHRGRAGQDDVGVDEDLADIVGKAGDRFMARHLDDGDALAELFADTGAQPFEDRIEHRVGRAADAEMGA